MWRIDPDPCRNGSPTADAAFPAAEAIGRPAIPAILSAFLKVGDTDDISGKINACFVDGTLREIVGDAAGLMELKPFQQPSKDLIERTVKYWYIWWYETGHKQDSFNLGGDEGEEEDE